MRYLVIQRIIARIEDKKNEFPCGFEEMAREEGIDLPERYLDGNWDKENPQWIIEVTKAIPKMSDKLLLEIYDQFLCLEYR